MDASGSRDQVIIPTGAPKGCRKLTIRPAIGHAWSYSCPLASSQAVSVPMDEVKEFIRTDKQSAFEQGGIPLFVAVDTGTNAGTGTLE